MLDRRLTSHYGLKWEPHNGFPRTFLNIWSYRGNTTSIPLYRTAVHVQNGARRQLRALSEPGRGPAGGSRSSRVAMTAGGSGGLPELGSGRVRKPVPERRGNAGEAVDVMAEQTGPHSPVKLSGSIPPLAVSFHQRPETGLDLRVGLYPGDTVVLTHGGETGSAPAGQGGTGKTQIAVAFSHALWGARAVDALVWVPATSRAAIVTGFAQAARTVGAADHALPADAAAGRFIGWLAHTRRPWALILDDLVSAADLEGLWPAGQAGQVVITTRLPEAAFRSGPRIAPVGGFSRREVLAYLGARLTDFPDQRAEALDLGADLDGLPLALAQAAAVMSLNRLSCREYRGRLGARRGHMATVRVDGVSPAVLATWSLAAECAHELPPAGAAWPALALAAMLDPHGIPGTALTSPAGCGYVAGRPRTGDPADQTLVRAAMTNLARAGLVSIDPASAARTVRIHPSVQAAVRAYLPAADHEQAVLAAAEALLQAWPEPGASQDPTARHRTRPRSGPPTRGRAGRTRARRPSRASCGSRNPTRCCSATG